MCIVNTYAYSGADQTPKLALESDDLCRIIRRELDQQPSGPKVFVGDLNASICTIPTLNAMINEFDNEGNKEWYDLGSHADQFDQPVNEGTCKAPN